MIAVLSLVVAGVGVVAGAMASYAGYLRKRITVEVALVSLHSDAGDAAAELGQIAPDSSKDRVLFEAAATLRSLPDLDSYATGNPRPALEIRLEGGRWLSHQMYVVDRDRSSTNVNAVLSPTEPGTLLLLAKRWCRFDTVVITGVIEPLGEDLTVGVESELPNVIPSMFESAGYDHGWPKPPPTPFVPTPPRHRHGTQSLALMLAFFAAGYAGYSINADRRSVTNRAQFDELKAWANTHHGVVGIIVAGLILLAFAPIIAGFLDDVLRTGLAGACAAVLGGLLAPVRTRRALADAPLARSLRQLREWQPPVVAAAVTLPRPPDPADCADARLIELLRLTQDD